MEDYSDHIAIVFPVTSAVPLDFDIQEAVEPHCTLIYLGRISKVSFTKEDVQSVLDRMNIKTPGEVATGDLALFGPDEDVLVMKIDPSKLEPVRAALERSLKKVGAENGSEYKDYSPHVTLDAKTLLDLPKAEETVEVPKTMTLDAPELWWGDN